MSVRNLSMDDVLSARFGNDLSTINVTFKKTVKIREYETEVIEASSSVKIEENATGIERMLATSLLTAQLEYAVYTSLRAKGRVADTEFKNHTLDIERDINLVAAKYEALTGENPLPKYGINP